MTRRRCGRAGPEAFWPHDGARRLAAYRRRGDGFRRQAPKTCHVDSSPRSPRHRSRRSGVVARGDGPAGTTPAPRLAAAHRATELRRRPPARPPGLTARAPLGALGQRRRPEDDERPRTRHAGPVAAAASRPGAWPDSGARHPGRDDTVDMRSPGTPRALCERFDTWSRCRSPKRGFSIAARRATTAVGRPASPFHVEPRSNSGGRRRWRGNRARAELHLRERRQPVGRPPRREPTRPAPGPPPAIEPSTGRAAHSRPAARPTARNGAAHSAVSAGYRTTGPRPLPPGPATPATGRAPRPDRPPPSPGPASRAVRRPGPGSPSGSCGRRAAPPRVAGAAPPAPVRAPRRRVPRSSSRGRRPQHGVEPCGVGRRGARPARARGSRAPPPRPGRRGGRAQRRSRAGEPGRRRVGDGAGHAAGSGRARPDDDPTEGLLALRDRLDPVELVGGVVDDLAVHRRHRLQRPGRARRAHLVGHLLGEAGQGLPAALAVAGDVDAQPAPAIGAPLLGGQPGQVLDGDAASGLGARSAARGRRRRGGPRPRRHPAPRSRSWRSVSPERRRPGPAGRPPPPRARRCAPASSTGRRSPARSPGPSPPG